MGGIGKSTLIKELDALGGVLPKVADLSSIHHRTLNVRKGRAVQGNRQQMDRDAYQRHMREELRAHAHLHVEEAVVEELQAAGGRFEGVVVRVAGERAVRRAAACVLTTGTFLNGRIRIGEEVHAGGRSCRQGGAWEGGGNIGGVFAGNDIRKLRLRTGTPPRLLRESIDFSAMEEQPSEAFSNPFHLLHRKTISGMRMSNVSCFLSHTNERTARIVQKHRHLLPDYKDAAPPRYCPSIDAKYLRFADRSEHQIWFEPEGISSSS